MAKGDSKKAQKTIDTQGGLAQNNLNQLWGDYNNLAYGNQPQYSSQPPIKKPAIPSYYSNPTTGVFRGARSRMGEKMAQSGQFDTGASSGATQGGFNLDTVNQLLAPHGGVLTPESLAAIEPELKKYGVTLQRNSAGEIRGRVYLQDGTAVDLIDQWGKPPVFKTGGENANGPGGGSSGGYMGGLHQAIGGYGDFAKTGGFSPQDLQDIRARALSPIRANYSLAQDELMRGRNLSGGYMPNFAPAQAKMAREQSYAMSDANVNTSAMLAEAIRSGKLAGLSGLTGLGLGLGQQRLGAAGLQNQLAQILINGQIGKSQMPSDFGQAMGNIGSVASLVAPAVLAPFTGGASLLAYGPQLAG